MQLIRILHIVYTMNRGGMESRIMDLYRNLDRTRYQFDFYIESGNHGIYDDEIVNMGGRLYYSKEVYKYNIPNFRSFYQFISNHGNYKIIYAYNQWSGFYLKEAKKCGVPNRIAYARTCIQTKSLKNIIKNLVKLNVNKYATQRFAVSKKASYWLFGEKKTNVGDVYIWPNAIDTKKFAYTDHVRNEVRQELGLENNYVIIHVGNIRFEKNHGFLLEIFSEIKKKHENAKLILIGGGNIECLQLKMKKLNIEEAVAFLGVRQDIPRLLQAGDVFIFPSRYEGFPGAVLEAEASGLNCIISDAITDEVILTNHIISLPLSDSGEKWAEEIEHFKIVNRENAWKNIKDAGYDIEDLTKKTQRFFNTLISVDVATNIR